MILLAIIISLICFFLISIVITNQIIGHQDKKSNNLYENKDFESFINSLEKQTNNSKEEL